MRSRLLTALLLLIPSVAIAEVRLPNVLSDHAVLQREQPVRIWGWGRAGEHVTISFHEQNLTATADDFGHWEATLKPEAAGGPYTLTVKGDATASPITRSDILVGDVWIASGQSNMEMPLQGFNADTPVKDQVKEIAAANHPRMRLLLQRKRPSAVPLSDTEDTWTVCTPDTAKTFSAVAYFFGRTISEQQNVPVGLIDTSWGGTPAQAWMSTAGAAYTAMPSVYLNGSDMVFDQGRADDIKATWAAQDAADKATGRTPVTHPRLTIDRNSSWTPAALYNGMIAPYTKLAIRGAIWYQGEADQSLAMAPYYQRVFTGMIQDWRRQWAQGDFPFLFVQLSSWGSNTPDGWSTVRDAQRRTLSLINTGMAVTLDVGHPTNIHPPDKQTVGARLAASALSLTYGSRKEGTSPMFTQATREPSAIRAWFTHADGLAPKTGAVEGFEIAGADRKYVPAQAKVEVIAGHQTVVATAPTITAPVYIRYGWTPVVTGYVYNSAGLPLGTFTSEP